MSVVALIPDRSRLDARARAIAAFVGFAAGLWLAREWSAMSASAWAGAAAICAGLTIVTRHRTATAMLALATLGAGGAVWASRMHDRAPDSVAARIAVPVGSPLVLVDVEGVALADPEHRLAQRGALTEHVPPFMRQSDWYLARVRVDTIHTERGPQRASGIANVSTTEAPEALAGDRVRVRGRARATRPPANPGEESYVDSARASGDAFWIGADDGSLVRVVEHPSLSSAMYGAVRGALAVPRRSARAIIDRATGDDDAGALVRGLLLGDRETDGPGLAGAFRRIGLAHLLSVSGFHVAVMAFVALLAVRATGDRGWIEPAIVAVALAIYMLIVPVRAPILRAGLMVAILLASDALGRRHDRLAVLAWVGIAVLLWRPTDLFSIGFQLSFGLVAWLMVIAEPRADAVRIGVFEDPASQPLWRSAWSWMADMARATAACWSVSIPLVIYHTGAIAPLAIIATLLTVPLIVATMWIGFVTLLVGAVAPLLIAPLGELLRWPAGVCASIVRWFDTTPLATLYLPTVSLAWTVAATAVVVWLWRRGRVRSVWSWVLPAAAIVWLSAEVHAGRQLPKDVAARATMLEVGNGTAIVVQSGTDALLWDCGSFREHIGVRDVPDACRAIGAARVPVVVLTHANIDHFMGLIDLAPRLGVRTVVTGESFARAAEDGGSARALLDSLAELGVEHRVVAAGDLIGLGTSRLRVLHPPRGFVARSENDASLVARLEPADGSPTMMLTGDIQDEAMAMLMESGVDLAADVIELPHHGSAREAAYAFVLAVDPSVVLQSTGPQRMGDPRWDHVRQGRHWFSTPMHGAVRADLCTDGTVEAGPVR